MNTLAQGSTRQPRLQTRVLLIMSPWPKYPRYRSTNERTQPEPASAQCRPPCSSAPRPTRVPLLRTATKSMTSRADSPGWCPAQALAPVRRPPSAVRRPPSAVRRPPSAVRRPPSAVRRPPSAVRRPPSAVRRRPMQACSLGDNVDFCGKYPVTPQSKTSRSFTTYDIV